MSGGVWRDGNFILESNMVQKQNLAEMQELINLLMYPSEAISGTGATKNSKEEWLEVCKLCHAAAEMLRKFL